MSRAKHSDECSNRVKERYQSSSCASPLYFCTAHNNDCQQAENPHQLASLFRSIRSGLSDNCKSFVDRAIGHLFPELEHCAVDIAEQNPSFESSPSSVSPMAARQGRHHPIIVENDNGPETLAAMSTRNRCYNTGQVRAQQDHTQDDLPPPVTSIQNLQHMGGRQYATGSPCDQRDVAVELMEMGRALQQMGILEAALAFYQQFLLITTPMFGRLNSDVDFALKCMAHIHYCLGDKERALELYREIIIYRIEYLGIHPEVALILSRAGNICFELGDYNAALGLYTQGLEVERAVLPREHPNIIITLSNIAHVCQLTGDFVSAVEAYKEALAIQMSSLGRSHPAVAETLSRMGLTFYRMKQYWCAFEFYQSALKIRCEASNIDPLDIASSHNSIGLVLFKLGVHASSIESFRKCLLIRRAILGDEHRDVSVMLYNIATVYLTVGNDEEALMLYQECLQIDLIVVGATPSDIVLSFEGLARTHEQRGELHEALDAWTRALTIRRTFALCHNEVMVATLNEIADLNLQLGNTIDAMNHIVEAARIAQRSGSTEIRIGLSGFHFYAFSKMHPEAAASA